MSVNINSSTTATAVCPSISANSTADYQDSRKTPLILNGKYFKIVKETDDPFAHRSRTKSVIASCRLCVQGKTLKGSLKITSNFVKHLKTKHHSSYESFIIEKKSEVAKLRKRKKKKCNNPTTNTMCAFSSISTDNIPMKPKSPLLFNGTYFQILKEVGNTVHQREATGIIAACQLCPQKRTIKGSLRITSNFVQHLKTKHHGNYEKYLLEKQKEGKRSAVFDREWYNDSSTTVSSSTCSSDLHSTDTESSSANRMPLIVNGEYFKIIKRVRDTVHEKAAKGIIAVCQLCTHKRTIKGSLRITSNFVQHLKTKHRQQYEIYLLRKENIKWSLKEVRDNDSSMSELSSLSISPLPDAEASLKGKMFQNGSNFAEKLLSFICDSCWPLSTVENATFQSLFKDIPLEVCGQKNLARILEAKCKIVLSDIRERLENVSFVSLMARICPGKNAHFLEYTCHWINFNFSRQSVLLAFRRLPATYTLSNILDLIQVINADFGLCEEKVVCTLIRNWGKQSEIKDSFHRLSGLNRCLSDSLNDLITKDFTNMLSFDKLAYETQERCFQRIKICCDLKTPNSPTPVSMCVSLKQLLAHKEKLNDLCSALNVAKFHLTELNYLQEYCSLMEPIVDALIFLENDKSMFYGYILPTLVTTKVKLQKLQQSESLNYLKDIAQQMENTLFHRFKNFFEMHKECHAAVLAAISHPSIKLRFIQPLNISFDDLQSLIIQYAKEFEGDVNHLPIYTNSGHSFFDFGQRSEEIVRQHKTFMVDVKKEVRHYLEDKDCSLCSLSRYPVIQKMFAKYNTPLSSTAPVERLFSCAGICNLQGRQNLSTKHFEKIMIIRANNNIF